MEAVCHIAATNYSWIHLGCQRFCYWSQWHFHHLAKQETVSESHAQQFMHAPTIEKESQ